jgi:hypothetical protein
MDASIRVREADSCFRVLLGVRVVFLLDKVRLCFCYGEEWVSNLGVVLDEVSVEVAEVEEGLEFLGSLGNGPFILLETLAGFIFDAAIG